MRARDNRLVRVRRTLDSSPVRLGALREAYEWFTGFGELPDDDHVAFEVVQQALRGGKDASLNDEVTVGNRVRRAKIAYHGYNRPCSTWPPSVRALLFDEALFEIEPLRNVARAAIAAEVAWGGDVESEGFAARHGIPCCGTVAMHVCGWQTRLAVPPYEKQAKRLFVRIDNLHGRRPSDDCAWLAQLNAAIQRCCATGELPNDDILAEGVLTQIEMGLLRRHRAGEDVKDAMEVLDQIVTGDDDEVAQALGQLKELASAGRL